MKLKHILLIGILGSSCFVIGYSIAVLSVSVEILIDYQSGDLQHRTFVGPILVRNEPVRITLFQSYPPAMSDGDRNSRQDWRRAFVFRLNSNQSPNYSAGQVVNQLARIGNWFPVMPKADASKLKRECIDVLSQQGESDLRLFIDRAEKQIITEYGSSTQLH